MVTFIIALVMGAPLIAVDWACKHLRKVASGAALLPIRAVAREVHNMSVKRPDVLPAQHSNVDFMNPQEIGLNSSGLRETITLWRFARFVMVSRESLQEDFDNWRRERELVEAEMNRIIGTVLSGRKEDRTIRAAQFAALIERREAAARKVLPPNDLVKQLRAAAEPNQ